MRLSIQDVQKRADVVLSMLQNDPKVSNADLKATIKKKFGQETTDKFINKCRQNYVKAAKKFAGIGSKPLGAKNGVSGPILQTSAHSEPEEAAPAKEEMTIEAAKQ